MVDSEFCEFQEVIATAVDFQTVLRAHKNFVANVLRMSLIDNASVQEGIERVLQVCLRFIAVCRLLHRAEQATEETEVYSSKSDLLIFVPPEEFAAIHKEFYSQVLFLFQIMRKVESRGFLFRLDFNGFLSSMAQGVQSKV